MILVGRYASPFVRRVAISLRLLDMPYDHKALSAAADREAVSAYNPLGRVPALVLDDGEVLIDSAAILDHLDQLAGPERALVPSSGPARRRVLKLVSLGVGAAEKSVACYLERNVRSEENRSPALLDRFADQALAGLSALEAAAGPGWLCGERVSQADVTAVAAYDFLRLIWADRLPAGRFPGLEALRERAYVLPAFSETKP